MGSSDGTTHHLLQKFALDAGVHAKGLCTKELPLHLSLPFYEHASGMLPNRRQRISNQVGRKRKKKPLNKADARAQSSLPGQRFELWKKRKVSRENRANARRCNIGHCVTRIRRPYGRRSHLRMSSSFPLGSTLALGRPRAGRRLSGAPPRAPGPPSSRHGDSGLQCGS